MAAKHIYPGQNDPTCGIAVAARQLISRELGHQDEVWVHSMWLPMVIIGSLVALFKDKKLIRMPHGCTDPVKLRHHWHKKRWVAPFERWLFRRADKIVATCEDEVAWIRAFEPGVKKIEVVSLMPQTQALQSKCPICPTRLETPKSRLNLLYIGRLHPLKGVEYLLEAMPNDDKLIIIGKDEGEGNKLKAIVSRRNLDVEFRGIVSDTEKEDAFQWCDCLVLPTLSENFGLVIAEALEHGKRVITTDGAPAWADGNTYGNRLTYLNGYRDGSQTQRVAMLKEAIESLCNRQ